MEFPAAGWHTAKYLRVDRTKETLLVLRKKLMQKVRTRFVERVPMSLWYYYKVFYKCFFALPFSKIIPVIF